MQPIAEASLDPMSNDIRHLQAEQEFCGVIQPNHRRARLSDGRRRYHGWRSSCAGRIGIGSQRHRVAGPGAAELHRAGRLGFRRWELGM